MKSISLNPHNHVNSQKSLLIKVKVAYFALLYNLFLHVEYHLTYEADCDIAIIAFHIFVPNSFIHRRYEDK